MKTEAKQKFGRGTSLKLKSVKTVLYIAALAVLAGGAFAYMKSTRPAEGKYDAFAQCIKDSGAIFYGAFWCPHCQNQKAAFGDSAHLLPYVECSLPDASGQTGVCIANGIHNYPTWVLKDGSRLTGEIPLATLSEKTRCELPK